MAKRWVDTGSGPGVVVEVPDEYADELEQYEQALRFFADLKRHGLDEAIVYTLDALREERQQA